MLIVSIALEAAVAILAVLAARRGKPYIYGLAFTFGAYVLYDLARLLHWNVQAGIHGCFCWRQSAPSSRYGGCTGNGEGADRGPMGGRRRHARILVESTRAR